MINKLPGYDMMRMQPTAYKEFFKKKTVAFISGGLD
jgi:hypothetical protein